MHLSRSIFQRIAEIRELNNQENELINHRLTWMLVIEGLMINACIVIIKLFFTEHYDEFLYLLLAALSLMAFIISMSFYIALDHSRNTLNRLRNYYCFLIKKLNKLNSSMYEMPLAIGLLSCNNQLKIIRYLGDVERKNQNRFEPWNLLPKMFIAVWGILFAFSLIRGLLSI